MEEAVRDYAAAFPDPAAQFERTQKANSRQAGKRQSPAWRGKEGSHAQRRLRVMNAIAESVPELFGGAADLTASTKTIFKPELVST